MPKKSPDFLKSSSKLRYNLTVSSWAIQQVKGILTYGATNRTDSCSQSYRRTALFQAAAYKNYTYANPQQYLKLAYKFQAGNCSEQALLAYYFLLFTIKEDINIECVANRTIDHTFLIIQRNKNSQINNYRTWGRNAVVCDPWANRYYPANEFPFQMNDSTSARHFIGSTGNYLPKLTDEWDIILNRKISQHSKLAFGRKKYIPDQTILPMLHIPQNTQQKINEQFKTYCHLKTIAEKENRALAQNQSTGHRKGPWFFNRPWINGTLHKQIPQHRGFIQN